VSETAKRAPIWLPESDRLVKVPESVVTEKDEIDVSDANALPGVRRCSVIAEMRRRNSAALSY